MRRGHARTRSPTRAAAWLALAAASLGSLACSRGPTDGELDQWLEEARAADREAIAAHGDDDERARWTLTIVSPGGAETELRWPELERMAHTTIDTDLPPEGDVPRRARFRAVTLHDLLERVGGSAGHRDITLVANDGFRATIEIADVDAYPIGLAVEADGHPIDRASGGPLFTVFPISAEPSLIERYTSSWWVFYVTHVLLDTPPARVRVIDERPGRDPTPHVLDEALLESLPRNQVTMGVGYRTGWPSEPVVLEGVLVRELVQAAGLVLGAGEQVRVMTIAPLTRGELRPTVLTADDVMLRPSMLARRWGAEGTAHDPGALLPIPARLGGPLALAVPSDVQSRLGDRVWLTHVTDVVVQGPAAPGASTERAR
ncbi:MAG: hypothetical protein K1X94_08060 [Sandaracinaceae bacterium]|nr:hypothetical protein [Sandaracinaceae bacterium]